MNDQPTRTTVELRRLHNGDHFFTTNVSEFNKVSDIGFSDEGSVGWISVNQKPGTVPLYRYWNNQVRDHFYTVDPEPETLETSYQEEGIAGYIWMNPETHIVD